MNTRLEKLFEIYNFSEKNKYEINQIFGLLPMKKQQNLLNNFNVFAFKIQQINKEINLERRILIGDLFQDIESFYSNYGDKIGNL
ncbi:MAG: hypothetical protein Q8K30_06205 [Candidatus Gracilibacteria bacterium]|nr:hypothetical protein [Candidatus Gracilibacteria bacterium]